MLYGNFGIYLNLSVFWEKKRASERKIRNEEKNNRILTGGSCSSIEKQITLEIWNELPAQIRNAKNL